MLSCDSNCQCTMTWVAVQDELEAVQAQYEARIADLQANLEKVATNYQRQFERCVPALPLLLLWGAGLWVQGSVRVWVQV